MMGWIKSLLMHEQQRCDVCGGMQPYASALPLCRECLQQIPWIRHIQCPICGRPDACPDCMVRKIHYVELQRSAVRYDPSMREWLSRYKYAGEEQLAELFARMMAHAFAQLLDADEVRSPNQQSAKTVLTFVPSGQERLASRGFNQSARLAMILSKAAHLPIYPLLRKVQSAEHQSHKNKAERMRSVQGLYALNDRAVLRLYAEQAGAVNGTKAPANVLRPVRIMIIDDVYTTGSTLNECGRLLKAGLPCTVLGLTWARS